MKHLFIINPAAGSKDRTEAYRRQIESVCQKHGIDYEIAVSKAPSDCTAIARQAAQSGQQYRIYACGGDGTFNEVASGAYGFAHAAVGLIPVGTGNDFMRNFVGTDRFMDVSAQKEGEVMELDLIRCNDYYGVNLLNTGFDCEVVVKTSEIKRSRLVPKGMAYGMGVAIELIRKPGVTVELSVDDGEPMQKELLLCAVGNGARYGGGFTPLPFASLRDGLLDVCIVKNVSRLTFVKLVGSYKKGEHVIPQNAKILDYLKCRKIHMKFPRPQNVCMDGEVRQMQECDIEVIPAGLRFVLPVGCAPIVRPEFSEHWNEQKALQGAAK